MKAVSGAEYDCWRTRDQHCATTNPPVVNDDDDDVGVDGDGDVDGGGGGDSPVIPLEERALPGNFTISSCFTTNNSLSPLKIWI